MLLELIVFLIVLFAINHVLGHKRNKHLPPGPLSLPLLGNVLQLGKFPHIRFMEWSQTYGSIFKIQFGSTSAIVLNDYNDIKEMFADARCVGRMRGNPIADEFAQGNNGIATAEGDVWVAQRRFALRTLHQLGFSKVSMEGMILDEAHATVTWLESRCGRPITGTQLFNAAVVNSIWRLISGERCDWEQGKSKILTVIDNFMRVIDVVCTNGVFFAPILKDIAPDFFHWNLYRECVRNALELFTETINEHKATFDPNNLRDYIDIYLNEIYSERNPKSSFFAETGEKQLRAQLFDLFLGGSETTSSLLSWGLLYLGTHPHVQEKVQREIDSIVGKRTPFLTDRSRMPYTEAVLNELLRISPILPIGIPHRLLDDMEFHGYSLTKGTSVFPNVYGVLHDPTIWEDPDSFKPERFLNENGTKAERHAALITFSEGRRKCIGEGMSRDTAFLFLVKIFQRFDLELEEDFLKKPNFEPAVAYLTRPQDFNVIFNLRNITNE